MKDILEPSSERVIARHSDSLIRTGPSAEILLATFSERLMGELRAVLPSLVGETQAELSCDAPAIGPDSQRVKAASPSASFWFATATEEPAIFASIDGRSVISLVDRSFGGAAGGETACPKEFPSSARLMIARIETMLLDALKRSLGLDQDGLLHCPTRSRNAGYAPFRPDCRTAELVLTIAEPGHRPWTITFVLLCSALDQLFGHGERGSPGAGPVARSGDPAAAPWGDIPLMLSAVLVDMNIAIGAVSQIDVGQLIPVTVPREMPLRLGPRCIARGHVGAIDGQFAVELSSIA